MIHNKHCGSRKISGSSPCSLGAACLASCPLTANFAQETVQNAAKPGHTTKHLAILSVILAELKAGGPGRSELLVNYEGFSFAD